MTVPARGLVARVVRGIEITEDIVHVAVGILLTVLAIVLIVDTARYIAVVLAGPYNLPVIVLAFWRRLCCCSSSPSYCTPSLSQ